MPRPRKYEDVAEKQLAYRIRKERERLALNAALLDLARAIGQSRGAVVVCLDGITTDEQARMLRELARVIDAAGTPLPSTPGVAH